MNEISSNRVSPYPIQFDAEISKMQNPNSAARGEADRLLAVAEKLLQSRDLVGARDFAILAQENEPLLEGSDQILAISEVLISSEKRVNQNHHDWYSILQIDRRSDDLDLIKKQYRRLALLLHPDKNQFPLADHAFQLVADAWGTLSDPVRKSQFDRLVSSPFAPVELVSGRTQTQGQTQSQFSQPQGYQINFSNPQQQVKLPVRRSDTGGAKSANGNASASFWTTCPYCYVLYEYPRVYEGCCLKCQSCERAFSGVEISALPPIVPGKEEYHCCWAYFPIGFKSSEARNGGNEFPNWMPPMFNSNGSNNNITNSVRPVQQVQQNSQPHVRQQQTPVQQAAPLRMGVDMSFGVRSADDGGKKKRGRPRKYPL